LHTKIIESIINIQRWFRSILQRQKFLHLRQAAIVIQSNWRMCLAQKQVNLRRGCFHGAAITIQATWRMYIARKKYSRIHRTVVLLQAHIRGKLARMKYQQMKCQKHMRERQKLRSTQSLPVNERGSSMDAGFHEPIKRIRTPTPHYSLDADIELCPELEESPIRRLSKQKRDQMLDQTEQQIRNLLINKDEQYNNRIPSLDSYSSGQSSNSMVSYRHDDVLDLGTTVYDVEKAMRRSIEEQPIETLKRFDKTKMPIRRVDSGPGRREIRLDSKSNVPLTGPTSRPSAVTDVEIVFVNSGQPSLPSTSSISSSSASQCLRSSPYNQQYSLETLPQRRDIVCRSLNNEYQNFQPPIVYHQQNYDNRTTISVPPKGM
jgi:IQ calmodulin-binding motif